MSFTDSLLKERILAAREKSLLWLNKMQLPNATAGVLRVSELHQPEQWPQMLLPGTYDGTMARVLLGDEIAGKEALADWILGHQGEDGFFQLPGLCWNETWKGPDAEKTRQYMRFHTTNYCMGTLEVLDQLDRIELPFLKPYLDAQYFWAWLGQRDMRDPWLEGNNIVNIGSFLLLEQQREPNGPAAQRLQDMIFWHNQQSEPYSGFWGPGQQYSQEALLFALCGATHNLHVFYALDENIPYFNQSISRCLEQPLAIRSSCIDVDIIDILAHGHARCPYRSDEIEHWLRSMLVKLLDFQNADGGFPDTLLGERGYDGWVKGYKEPQGHSNTFATWFRWIAIAMIAHVLWPQWQDWRFRKTIGIGYFKNLLR
ncbi:MULTISPECIES: hypothetical protein [Enterobacter]|jgi:hypothetical protein|uniref:Uncharacterized protein n=1 Tax=Enterobacter rongchengensis TaxID=3030999 RepID=A0ABV4JGY2_9ENTR|nr:MULTISPECIES: hypothetical protein [Enterobacter]PNL54545.1 hypothetical protein CEP65_017780 [Enterobacter hormaechei]HCR0842197.1 hypothetical protein [Enterobacter cancerogenus]EKX4010173.1 hypothetical protein [Enterobacter cloacae]ELV3042062.1 hypothetical protein [Enterobacter chengduensis]KJM01738.1 hypothetical protein SS39_12365 [Enterobacter chengduensis]